MSDPIQVGGSWKCDLCGGREDGSSYHNCPAQQAGASCPHLHQYFPGTAVNKCLDCGARLPEEAAEPSCMQLKGWKCAEPDNEAAEVPAMCPKCQEAYACGHCGGLYYALSTSTVAQPAERPDTGTYYTQDEMDDAIRTAVNVTIRARSRTPAPSISDQAQRAAAKVYEALSVNDDVNSWHKERLLPMIAAIIEAEFTHKGEDEQK